MWNRKPALAAIAAASLLASPAAAITFTPLGDLAGGDFNSTAYGISNDGTTVVGTSSATLDFGAFRWTSGSGMVPLADLAGGGDEGTAYAVSGDGSVAAGYGTAGSGSEATTWTSPTNAPIGLGTLGDWPSFAYGISADGTTIVGQSKDGSGATNAFRYSGGVMTSLGDFAGGPNVSSASAVSDDGSVIVGHGSKFGPVTEAFRWTGGVMTGLGDLAGGSTQSRALGVSGDGSIVIGESSSASSGSLNVEAFLWSVTAGSMSGLGDLAGGLFESRAYDANADGSAIVGHGTTADGKRATLWNANGIFDLNVIAAAVLPSGWQLTEAFGVSADGLSIAGRGSNAAGNTEAFLLTLDAAPIPEPGTGLLLALGLVGLAARRR